MLDLTQGTWERKRKKAKKETIEQGVQLYFDSMYESDPAKVREAFYPNAMITGYLETSLAEMNVDQFAKFVEKYEAQLLKFPK